MTLFTYDVALKACGWTKITTMTRIVGTSNHTEFTLDPVEAWHRGHRLDHMLAVARVPTPRGAQRAPHRVFNQIDDAKQLAQARLINQLPIATPAQKT